MTLTKLLLITTMLFTGTAAAQLKYPAAATDNVIDDYFGIKVADPYRWLENDSSDATAAWVAAQNEVSSAYLSKIPFRNALKQRLTSLYRYERMGSPFKVKGKYYFFRNNGLQNQDVMYVQDALDAEPRVFFDPNTLSDDGTVALNDISFSEDGKYFAYVISRSGSDWNEIFVAETATGRRLDDHIIWAKFTGAAWCGDGFFYSAYDAPEDGVYSSKNEFHKVMYHKIGTPQSADVLEYNDTKNPLMFHNCGVSDDERFVFVYKSLGHGNAIYVKDMRAAEPSYKVLVPSLEDECQVIASDDKFIYILTAAGAPKRKIISIPVDDLRPEAQRDFIPEGDYVISSVAKTAHNFIITYEINACDHPQVFSLEGKHLYDIELPLPGSVGISASERHDEVFYRLSSYTSPGTVYSLDIASGRSTLLRAPEMAFNPDDFTTQQVVYNSKDGTPIRMFLTYKKGLKLNGDNPTLLYGYGGFNISLTPAFNARIIPFLEAGGIYAVANLRGGSEYGEEWHQAGTKLNKQNVFDDFIAAAEWLIAQKYTSPKRLACNGGSNGGLLVGAVVNQRPDLFAAAVPQVGVMDMMRYHLFTIGWNWAGDYGRSDDSPEMAAYLLKYSPLHNIKNDGTPYPAILVTTADHDDRVVPAHSFKYAATLQASNTGNNVKIIRIDSKAGHGGGKPISKIIDEYTDIYSFIMYHLGMTPKWK